MTIWLKDTSQKEKWQKKGNKKLMSLRDYNGWTQNACTFWKSQAHTVSPVAFIERLDCLPFPQQNVFEALLMLYIIYGMLLLIVVFSIKNSEDNIWMSVVSAINS